MKYLSILFIFIFSLTTFGQIDTTAPEISNFGFFPPTINIANGSEDLTVSLRASDDASGVSNVRVRFRSPSGSQTIDADLNYESLVSGDNKDGLYNKTVTFTQSSEVGIWLVEYVYARDEAGNERFVYTSELMARPFRTRLPVSAVNCTYSLNSTSQDFPASSGNGVVIGTTQIGCTASLIGNSSFITANSISASGNLGSGTLTITVPFSVAANSGAARTGTIIVSGQTFTVNQAAGKSRKRVRFF